MKTWISWTAIALLGLQTAAARPAQDPLTAPIANSRASEWLRPQTPLRIYGDSYYVGTAGLSAVLIDTHAGLILIDATMPQSAPTVEAHIRQLGFKVTDIKYILITEPHYDHAGGAAAIARDSGAQVVASPPTAKALRAGRVGPDDPQYEILPPMPAVARVREIGDGQSVALGRVKVTARFTPGHTAGSTSWTWAASEAGRRLDMVFGASLNPTSADGFRFSDVAAHGDLPAIFRRSWSRFAALPCDVLISAHPDNTGADRKLKALEAKRTPNPFIDPGACRDYAARAQALFKARIAKETAAAP